jgi:hypothetical protein
MTSLTDLREVVDVVIGVDIHVHTYSAAVLDTATGGVLQPSRRNDQPRRRQIAAGDRGVPMAEERRCAGSRQPLVRRRGS